MSRDWDHAKDANIWQERKEISGRASLAFQALRTLHSDGTPGARFQEFGAHFTSSEVTIRARKDFTLLDVDGFLAHGSARPADIDTKAQPEFCELNLPLKPQIFDAAWNELKFGQGAFQGRFDVMIQIYKPIWPDNYFILCDQRAAAYVETFEIVRVPFEMVD